MFKFLFFGKKYTEEEQLISQYVKKTFGYTPKNLSLYVTAFKHKSIYLNSKKSNEHNERLEFLGDAIIGAIGARLVFEKYPDASEGKLTQMRARIVSRVNLNRIGEEIELKPLIKFRNSSHKFKSLLGNTVESLVGAMYLDLGYKKTTEVLLRTVFKHSEDFEKMVEENKDYKSQLIIHCQKNKIEIDFKCLAETKQSDGISVFTMAIYIEKELVSQAEDLSKRKAEQQAAQSYIEVLEKEEIEKEKEIEKEDS